jgi:hypothetical protein
MVHTGIAQDQTASDRVWLYLISSWQPLGANMMADTGLQIDIHSWLIPVPVA